MGKREWRFPIEQIGNYKTPEGLQIFILCAFVERLEALVKIGDNLEEVGDLWANSLAFGGQPVGGIDQPEPATRGAWMCDGDSECILMKGHGGEHVRKPLRYCQCTTPDLDTNGVCTQCALFYGSVSDAPTA